ncbi:hypothetical protein ISP18_10070 [Dyella humi]|uniref:Uncharacterized protein n=2 Tax=Dyella humi TaxID=1770547 RepID=A0ABW8IKY9_9GAMM
MPGLIFASRMALIEAIGTSLFCVGAFGVTVALNYAASGWVTWPIAWSAQKLSSVCGALSVLLR